jgi:hypothetical protein
MASARKNINEIEIDLACMVSPSVFAKPLCYATLSGG